MLGFVSLSANGEIMSVYLNIRTLALMMGLVSIVLGAGMVAIHVSHKTYPGVSWWILWSVCYGIGALLLCLRRVTPDVFSIMLPNSLILVSLGMVDFIWRHQFSVLVQAKRGSKVRVVAIRDLSRGKQAEAEIKLLQGIIPICSFCKKVRNALGTWSLIEDYPERSIEALYSHGICSACEEQLLWLRPGTRNARK